MSVYHLDRKGLRQVFYEFHGTLYGRTVFFFAYFIPFLLFIIAAVCALFSIFYTFDITLINVSMACILAFVPSFILGNMYFYSEIRKFCAERSRHLRRRAREKKD